MSPSTVNFLRPFFSNISFFPQTENREPIRFQQHTLSEFCSSCPLSASTFSPNVWSLTSSNRDSLLYFLNYYSSSFLLFLCLSILSLYVHVKASGQSVSPVADVLDVNMFPPGRPYCGLPSLYFHQQFILMFCVSPLGSFQCSKMFPQHLPSEMLPLSLLLHGGL